MINKCTMSLWDFFIFLSGICIVAVITECQCDTLKFTLSAANLPNRDLDGNSDPIAKLWVAEGKGGFHKAGSSEKIDNNANPVWKKVFTYHYTKGANQTWRIFIKDWDLDCAWLFEDALGHVELKVDQYVADVEQTKGEEPIEFELEHPSGGTLKIHPVQNIHRDSSSHV